MEIIQQDMKKRIQLINNELEENFFSLKVSKFRTNPLWRSYFQPLLTTETGPGHHPDTKISHYWWFAPTQHPPLFHWHHLLSLTDPQLSS